FHEQYGAGYTAYEHGQLGACRPLEIARDFSSFCHHCHRVFIPVRTNCAGMVGQWFRTEHVLPTESSVQTLGSSAYVLYETGTISEVSHRIAYTEDVGIPSQFMRQILTSAMRTGRPYSWTADPRYEEMIETVARLRTEFDGLSVPRRCPLRPTERLPCSVTIDGLSGVGKT